MLHVRPGRAEFAELLHRANAVPIYCSLISDDLTPVSAFTQVAGGSKYGFLLESVIGGEKIARYSFLSSDPVAIVETRGTRTEVTDRQGTHVQEKGDPLSQVEKLLQRYRAAHPLELPRFLGGAVGYAGYDIARNYEPVGAGPADDRGLFDLQFGIYDRMVIFDHVRKVLHLVVYATMDGHATADAAYDAARRRLDELAGRLAAGRTKQIRELPPTESHPAKGFESTFSPAAFEEAVERAKQYIKAGDAFQIVLSQRLGAVTTASPFEVYRALRVIAPSPFMFYVQTPTSTLVGSSPEVLCRIEGRTVSTRPLAGTRPRGRTESEDRGLEAELLADPKERAEHVMLVDLGRNDLARVCEPGSVHVDELMSVERFSHVMHICSNVSGTLAEGKTAFDALRSVLPVGTVSGAPKIRAMQIIDELEPVRRGPYAGAVGYIDFAGNMDTCIALRTLVITPAGGAAAGSWRVDAQVGAGIVADSQPDREYQETLNKAKGMLSAVHMADAWANAKPS